VLEHITVNISYMTKDKGGCDFYRAMLPLDMLHEQKLASVMRVEKGDDIMRIETAFEGADAVLFPRLAAGEHLMRVIDQLHKDGKAVIVDLDDNIWKVNPLSPHYKDYGLVEYQHVIKDDYGQKKRIDVWKDGRDGFSFKRSRELLLAMQKSLEVADLVTTTTDLLADVLRKYNHNVKVLPNCVDMNRWCPLPLRPHDEVRLFWAGGSSHFEDWQILAPVLPVVMQRFPKVKLILMGTKFAGLLKNIPIDRVEFIPWEDNLSYPYKCAMLGADLAVIPLVDNVFNRCKSALKWIEQSALGVPCVMSGVSPYKEMYDGANAVMVEDNSTEGWIEAISTMIREPVLRARIGGNAQRYVEARYDIRKQAVEWLYAYESEKPKKQEDAWQLAKSAI